MPIMAREMRTEIVISFVWWYPFLPDQVQIRSAADLAGYEFVHAQASLPVPDLSWEFHLPIQAFPPVDVLSGMMIYAANVVTPQPPEICPYRPERANEPDQYLEENDYGCRPDE